MTKVQLAAGVTWEEIPETIVEGKRLGSHFHKDERSLNHPIQPLINNYQTDPTKLTSRTWARAVPPFDQGQVGSCTGNACAGMLATAPLISGTPKKFVGVNYDESLALELYHEATTVDGFGAPYPTNDRGSSTLGVLKGAHKLGWISGYKWGFGLIDLLNVLANFSSCIVGVNWYEGFDQPQSNGELKISGSVRGGHELQLDEIDVPNRLVWGWNSWGLTWDDRGQFCWSWDTIEQLLGEGGEVGVGTRGRGSKTV